MGEREIPEVNMGADTKPNGRPATRAVPKLWELYFDGLCEPQNPGGVMAWGWAMVCPHTGELFTGDGAKPAHHENTNNVAEYYALGFALKALADRFRVAIDASGKLGAAPVRSAGFDGLVIRGDSKLVVEQVNDRWRVTAPKLTPLHTRVRELLKEVGRLGPWQLEWIPRGENLLADQKTRDAYKRLTGVDAPVRRKGEGE
jgi:ribonuclease HI